MKTTPHIIDGQPSGPFAPGPFVGDGERKQTARPNGCELITAERVRQMEVEGWCKNHDDEHANSELSQAAKAYIVCAAYQTKGHPSGPTLGSFQWPWEAVWWRPSPDPVRNLVKAGALIAAEIDRLLRAAPAACDDQSSGPSNLEPSPTNAEVSRKAGQETL